MVYKIIEGTGLSKAEFEAKVEEALDEGFNLSGNLQVVKTDHGYVRYFQPVVKHEIRMRPPTVFGE
jgi:flavin-binding protein dodecin